MSELTTQEKIDLIKSVAQDGGEIVGEDELAAILESGEPLFTYDGFEPSGQMHIAQGIIRAINTNKMIKAGFTFRMWVADWFGYLNNKMGGDLEKIRKVGQYFIEVWRASGMDLDHTEFLWTSEKIADAKYWELVMKVAKHNSLNRILRTTEIMGRSSNDALSAAQIIYPCMQTADIFHVMKAQVVQLGMDQRKVNMLAREVGPELGFWKPVVVSHGMLRGLQKKTADGELDIEESTKLRGDVESVDREEDFNRDEIFNRPSVRELRFTLWSREYSIRAVYVKVLENRGKDRAIYHVWDDGKSGIDLQKEVKVSELDGFQNMDKVSVLGRVEDLSGEVIFSVSVAPSSEVANARATSAKMSKSKPETAVFMTDTAEDVARKIRGAYCSDGDIDDNPILVYAKQIIFEAYHLKGQEELLKDGFLVERPEKWGGNVTYRTYQEVEDAFASKELSSQDLKAAVTKYINILLTPVRNHFEQNAEAKKLLEEVQGFQVTR